MTMPYEPVIGLEVHAELRTSSKMFCACPVVDSISAEPNQAVCPVCAGMPGTLPVTNRQAVEYGLRVALALECSIAPVSRFARKNYFYPDLPKGYQISQYEEPLAVAGRLVIHTSAGERTIRIRRVHLEEDTGKLTHVTRGEERFSLVDLNRAGVPLLEIVTEPDMHSPEEVRAYAETLRGILRALGVNSGDLEKGVLRIEPNISVRPVGREQLGTRTEVKNLNSFRTLERAVAYEIQRQIGVLESGGEVVQETVGWDESASATFSQRGKEEAHDYRYFPEPDLPPLEVDAAWVQRVAAGIPELPRARSTRLQTQYGLSAADAGLLVTDPAVAQYFEDTLTAAPEVNPRSAAGWITGELFAWLRERGQEFEQLPLSPSALAELLCLLREEQITTATARAVLAEMLSAGSSRRGARQIVASRGLEQVTDIDQIAGLVRAVLEEYPRELAAYRAGKDTLSNWFFGQVMRRAGGQASTQVIRAALEQQLSAHASQSSDD